MDIRFCDICNESVPESDFAAGRAYFRKGRVICMSCDQAMGGELPTATAVAGAPGLSSATPGGPTVQDVAASLRPAAVPAMVPDDLAQAPAPRGSAVGAMALVLGLGSVAAIGLGGAILLERLEGLEDDLTRVRTDIQTASADAQRERIAAFAPLRDQIAGVEASSRTAAADALAEAREQIQGLEANLASRTAAESELRRLVDETRVALQELRAESAEARERLLGETDKLDKAIGFHGDKLVELEERIREAGALVAVGGAPQGAASASAAPAWQSHVSDLGNPDAGIRLDAVFALGETGDMAVVPHVTPMLQDADVFVRMSAAHALEDLRAKTAVPALIETLGDESSAVRESAVIALRTITGQRFGFDPAARDADRRKRADQWRSWWRRSGDDFLTS